MFDSSIRALVELWQKASETDASPLSQEIASARECLGHWPEVINGQVLKRNCPSLRIESGGLGKGYAVDLVVAHLLSRGVTSALIHFGRSSSYALGNAPNGEPWKLLVQFGEQGALGTITLRNAALSASDSFGQILRVQGSVLGHIIDPKTGELMREQVQAVVASANASEAEAASKVVLLGGIDTAIRQKLAFWALCKKDGVVHMTGGTSDSKATQFVQFTPHV